MTRSAALSLGIPAYFHPATSRDAWAVLASLGSRPSFVVVNVYNGPGGAPDPDYLPAVAALQAAGVRTIGYVDTDYGRRDPAVITDEVARYARWYGITGVFMDQVSASLADLDHYAGCVLAARTAGAQLVVLNPGTEPHPGYVDLADVTVTFEGSWAMYQAATQSGWVTQFPPQRFCHLVHTVPVDEIPAGVRLAQRRHVETVFLTDGNGDHPWDRLPASLTRALAAACPGFEP